MCNSRRIQAPFPVWKFSEPLYTDRGLLGSPNFQMKGTACSEKMVDTDKVKTSSLPVRISIMQQQGSERTSFFILLAQYSERIIQLVRADLHPIIRTTLLLGNKQKNCTILLLQYIIKVEIVCSNAFTNCKKASFSHSCHSHRAHKNLESEFFGKFGIFFPFIFSK